MKNYLRRFLNIAQKSEVGFILESVTWRAHSDWMKKLNYSEDDVININKKSIELLEEVRKEYEKDNIPMVLNASIGPRGDGYNPTNLLTSEESFNYH